ncbi:DUF5712 family protein [Hyunsoonleella ulvae]|uniref:DUF5712 family protein n=1 Tax=Hyunsoonleella ulvae TaxID=2799948 RepID=UPI0021CF0E2B|nr:DUF5712 family protein [Hyunsoonleella ulvae]
MKKEGHQTHIHIIVSRRDMSNSYSLSPGSKYKASEKTFDKKFGYNRNFVENYRAKNMFKKDPKKFFAIMAGLPTTEKQVTFRLLHKSGIHIPNIPTNSHNWHSRRL